MDHYAVPEENLPMFIKALYKDFSYLQDLNKDDITERFKQHFEFHPELNEYHFTPTSMLEWLDKIKQSLVSNAIWDLVKENKVELFWDDTVNDFVFMKKPGNFE